MADELVHAQADVSGNSAKQDGRCVAASVHRYGGGATVGMAELLV